MRRFERWIATASLVASVSTAHAYRLDYRWPQPTRDVQIAFTGNAPSGRAWTSVAKEMAAVWREVTGFTFVPVPGRATGCIEDAVSTVQFSQRICGLNFGPEVLTVTRSVSTSVNGGPMRRTDSDAFINTGPSLEGFAINFRWEQPSRTLSNLVGGTASSGTSYSAAVGQAATHWNLRVPFSFAVSTATADACDGDYSTTTVRFSPTVCDDSFGPRALAVTRSRFTTRGGVAYGVSADVLFNSAITWNVYDGPLEAATTDFRRVAIHEFGHVMGLDHSSIENAIMWPRIHDGYVTTCDDWRGVAAAYGYDPDAFCNPPAPRPPAFAWDVFRGPLPFSVEEQAEFRRSTGAIFGYIAGLAQSDTLDSLLSGRISDVEYPTCDDQAGLRSLYVTPGPCRNLSDVIFRDGFDY